MAMSLRETMSRDKRLGTSSVEVTVVKKRKLIETALLTTVFEDDSQFFMVPLEITHHIFSFLSGNDISRLAMASKKMSTIVANWTLNDSTISKIVKRLARKGNLTEENADQWREIALVAKRASLLTTVSARLQLIFHLMDKVHAALCSERLLISFDTVLSVKGIILHKFIAGWDHSECAKVFKTFMNQQVPIKQSFQRFISTYGGQDVSNEKFLRLCFRRVFLDHLKLDGDRAIWMGIFYHYMRITNFCKLLILLYGPTDSEDNAIWNFATNPRSFEEHIPTYSKLAKAIGSLQYVPNWSPSLSLEVLVYLSNSPSCWLLRSFSALLLPLSSTNINLVLDYFKVLYTSGRTSTASLLIGLVIMISQHSLRYNRRRFLIGRDEEDAIFLDEHSVHRLITFVISSPHLPVERSTIIKQIWDAVFDLAGDFADSAVAEGFDSEAVDDFHDLMEGWSSLAATLMSRTE